jgi:arabinofuranosyltransferase
MRHAAFGAALVATLVLLLAHAAEYEFLTDDAYISFRYARHLAEGHGLVFNPGLPPVEGYTNFLWVLLLAGLAAVGVPPEGAAPVLTVLATVALWAVVASWAMRDAERGGRAWTAVLPPLFLAATRSIAVWSTSGLETRLFEVLVVGGTMRLVAETRAAIEARDARDGGRPAPEPAARPWSAVLFALAALTRPDGILVYGSAAAVAVAVIARRRGDLRPHLRGAAFFTVVVAAHFLFRRGYYGEWLPNTFHAKVTGLRWDLGLAHHASFVLEYFAWVWVPLIVLGVVRLRRRGEAWTAAVIAAVVLPHTVYVAAVGGDHFEYRPQDLYLPFAFLLVAEGLRAFPAGRTGRAGVTAVAAVVLCGLIVIPRETHGQFPATYNARFPGGQLSMPEARVFLHPDRDPVLALPGLRQVAAVHRRLLDRTTLAFTGIRQEEHHLFVEKVMPEAEKLRALVEDGMLPADAHFALDSVGVIPYVSGLRVLDRLGLNDAEVARYGERSAERLTAHERRATLEYAREQGVDFWAFDAVHTLFRVGDPMLDELRRTAAENRLPVWQADAGDGWILLGLLPQGVDAARARFPGINWRPCA